jgi:spermidine synthase
MLYLALFSGLINLASQSVFMRVVSVLNGDYYLVFILTTLSFIVFSATGNLLAAHVRRWLPLFELAVGLYSLAGCLGIREFHLLETTVSDAAVVALLAPPALLLGLHLPAYAGAVRERLSLTYGVYHFGAAIGVLALEWAVLPWISLSVALGGLGAAQVVLAALVWLQNGRAGQPAESVEASNAAAPMARRGLVGQVLPVFFASIASYLCVSWGLHAVYGLTYPARMLIGVFNGCMLLAIALGALAAPYIAGRRLAAMTPVAPIALAAGLLLFAGAPPLIRHGLPALYAYFLAQSVLFGAPVFVSAIIYGRISADLAADTAGARAWSTGALMATSAAGNLAGGLISIACGLALYTVWPPLCCAIGFSAILFVLAQRDTAQQKRLLVRWAVVSGLAALMAWGVNFQPIKRHVELRYPAAYVLRQASLVSDMGSIAGAITLEERQPGLPTDFHGPTTPLFFFDGHISHAMVPAGDITFGLMAAMPVRAPFHRSLVLGLGSGQSALGVSMVSDDTDAVEVSPSVLEAASRFAAYNRQLDTRKDVHIYRADGAEFLRTCQPGSYDLVSNTVPYPVMFSSYKMYSAEVVRSVHRCLTPGGLYEGYIPGGTGQSEEAWQATLAPLYKSFRYVYLTRIPFLSFIASDRPLSVPQSLDLTRIVRRPADLAYVSQDREILQTIACAGWFEPPAFTRPGPDTPLTTFDDPVIERENTLFVLRLLADDRHIQRASLQRRLKPYLQLADGEQCSRNGITDSVAPRRGVASIVEPPLIPLFRSQLQN